MDSHDRVHQMIIDEVREIKKDVKQLLSVKNKVYGIVLCASAFMSLAFNYIFK